MAADRVASVLMTADTIGGVWTYATELARALAQCGVRVHLATMGGPVRHDQHQQLAGIEGLTLHQSGWRLEWMNDPWPDVERAGQWLLELEATRHPDVVHLNQFAFGALPFAAPTLLVAHSCVLSWWRAVHGEAAPAQWGDYHVRVSRGLAGAGVVAAPTRAMLDTLTQNYGFRGSHTRVLPNGRDPSRFRAAAKEPRVLAAGRFWDAAKNLGALESVAPRLPWPVRVAGSCVSPDGGVLQPRGVQVLGELTAGALADEMARASIYALPARYEPFGLSVLEAALAGCALVLGDVPSLREVWGDAAVYVAPDDPAGLEAALLALIHDTEERQRRAISARQRALQFGTARMADACVEAYAAARARKEATTCA